MSVHQADTQPPLTYTVDQAAALLGISRTTAYACVHTGELPTVRFGRRLLVPRVALLSLLDRPGTQASPP